MRQQAHIGTEAWLSELGARATPLWDRRPGPLMPAEGRPSSTTPASRRRWRRWRDLFGGEEILWRRLANANLPREQIGALLAGQQEVTATPIWVAAFRSIYLSDDNASPDSSRDRALDRDAPLPFEELFLNATRYARTQAASRFPTVVDVLTSDALASLERQLLAHLAFIAGGVLGQCFYEFRFQCAPLAAFETVYCEQPRTTDIYDAFVASMRAGRMLQVFDRYPVLARLISQAVEQWVANTGTLCARYAVDYPDLCSLLHMDLGSGANSIIAARAELSDRHYGGATTVALTLRGGDRLIYKPRGAGGEVGWAALVAWMNDQDTSYSLKVPALIDRESYQWNTLIATEACTMEDEVEAFYRRCGVTVAVLHVLAATDIHSENLIASKDHPVVVDLEMLLNPEPESDDSSLERTAMLPGWRTAPNGHRFDMSALGADRDQHPDIEVPTWRHINTDQMIRTVSKGACPDMAHRVQLGDAWPTAREYLDDLVVGFAAGYQCLLDGRQAICTDAVIYQALDGRDLRVLVRDSDTYARLLLHLLEPAFLRDGLDRSIEIEWLARPLGVELVSASARLDIYDVERRAMEGQDVPHFAMAFWATLTTEGEDDDLWKLGARRTPETLYRRLAALSEDDLELHISAIGVAVNQRFGSNLSAT